VSFVNCTSLTRPTAVSIRSSSSPEGSPVEKSGLLSTLAMIGGGAGL